MHRIDVVRRMDWLTADRATAYRRIVLIVFGFMVSGAILTSRDGIDHWGKPLGTDFLAFWSASRLALGGEASAVYDLSRIYAVERASVLADPGPSSFLYPPPFLLLCLPLALSSYLLSLGLWVLSTGLAYAVVARRWLAAHPGVSRGAILTILAFPAVPINLGHGQNGFLTAALLGGGLWLLDRRPWVAGVLLGALIVKPQIAFAIPILVVSTGRWRTAIAGAVTALSLCILSTCILGPETWSAFLAGGTLARGILEQGLVEPGKMVSVFSAVQVLGGGIALGYGLQGLVAAGAMLALIVVARRKTAAPGGHAALCAAATPLISPFFLDYDLTILAFPLAWLLNEGLRRGFLSWEKAILVCAYLLPLFARDLALGLRAPIAPLVLLAMIAACVRAVTLPQNRLVA